MPSPAESIGKQFGNERKHNPGENLDLLRVTLAKV
jgi:hypothetical protein